MRIRVLPHASCSLERGPKIDDEDKTKPPTDDASAIRRVNLLRLSVSFTQEESAALVEMAADAGLTRTELVRQIVVQWLREQRELSTIPTMPRKGR